MPPTDTNIYPGQHNNTEAQRKREDGEEEEFLDRIVQDLGAAS